MSALNPPGAISMNRLFRSLLTLVLLSSAAVAFAQRQGNTGTSALGGANALGGSSLGGSALGNAASSAIGGGTSIGGGAAQSGTTGFAGPQLNDASGALGQTINNGFIGRSDNTGRLIGSQNAGQQSTGVQQNFGALGNRGGGANSGGTVVQRPIRPQHRVSFKFPSRPAAEVQAAVSRQLASGPVSGFESVNLQINGDGIATLQGTVADEDQRKLVEAFVRLEPGVRSIVNDLSVASAAENP